MILLLVAGGCRRSPRGISSAAGFRRLSTGSRGRAGAGARQSGAADRAAKLGDGARSRSSAVRVRTSLRRASRDRSRPADRSAARRRRQVEGGNSARASRVRNLAGCAARPAMSQNQMKCPKCGYLGFESGDRCRNCGYEFSLVRRHIRSAGPAARSGTRRVKAAARSRSHHRRAGERRRPRTCPCFAVAAELDDRAAASAPRRALRRGSIATMRR